MGVEQTQGYRRHSGECVSGIEDIGRDTRTKKCNT